MKPCHPHDRVLSIAAGGPSLADTWQDLKGTVVAVNGSLQFLLDRGVVPWACGILDPGPQMKDIVPRHADVQYFVASICDPSLFEHLEGLKVRIWHPSGVNGMEDALNEHSSDWTLIGGGSTMGLRWLNLGYTLGFRKFEFHGLDSSYRGRATHAYPDHTDDAARMIIHGYPTKLAFVRQVSDFFALVESFSEDDVDPISVELHGDGWLQDRWATYRATHPEVLTGPQPATEDGERDKYQRMWGHAEYRKYSPGEHLVLTAISELRMGGGDSVIDFGCGPGRAAQAFKNAGFRVLGVDIADNSLDEGVNVPFRRACLWDLPPDIEEADYGFCCDVMEHIPPEQVDRVLANIKSKVRCGVLFNIAFFHETYGRLINERLHLTVRSKGWWLAKLREYWPDTEVVETVADNLPRAVFKAC